MPARQCQLLVKPGKKHAVFLYMERKTAQKAFSAAGQNDKKPRALFERVPGAGWFLFYCGVTVLFFRSSANSLETVDSVMVRSSVCVPSQSA